MDSLSHLMFSLAGGYLIAFGLKLEVKRYAIPLLAVASTLIDVDHLLPLYGITDTLIFHNIAVVMLATVALGVVGGWANALILATMLIGHLLMDMNMGLYGIPLLYPFSRVAYSIPAGWEMWLFNNPSYMVVSKTGIALALYLGFIVAVVSLVRLMRERRFFQKNP